MKSLTQNVYTLYSYGLWATFAVSFITIPITSGALSKRLDGKEQGVGLGVIHAMKGITWATSPYLFGALFNYFKNDGFLVTMPFMVAIVFICMAFPILFGPLRKYIRKYDENELKKGIAPVRAIGESVDTQDLLVDHLLVVGNGNTGNANENTTTVDQTTRQ